MSCNPWFNCFLCTSLQQLHLSMSLLKGDYFSICFTHIYEHFSVWALTKDMRLCMWMCVHQVFVLQKCTYLPAWFSMYITSLQQTCRSWVPMPRCLATISSTRDCLESVKNKLGEQFAESNKSMICEQKMICMLLKWETSTFIVTGHFLIWSRNAWC